MDSKNTIYFTNDEKKESEARVIIKDVYASLKERGYNPISQIVGYVLSGDPSYITSFNSARALITKIDRDDLLEEVFRYYLDGIEQEKDCENKKD